MQDTIEPALNATPNPPAPKPRQRQTAGRFPKGFGITRGNALWENSRHTLTYAGRKVAVRVVHRVPSHGDDPRELKVSFDDTLCRAMDGSCYYLVRETEALIKWHEAAGYYDPASTRAVPAFFQTRRRRIKRLSIRAGVLCALGRFMHHQLRADAENLMHGFTAAPDWQAA